MTNSTFNKSGFDLPQGQERRDALLAAGFNVSPEDCTPAELEAFKAEMDAVIDAPFTAPAKTS